MKGGAVARASSRKSPVLLRRIASDVRGCDGSAMKRTSVKLALAMACLALPGCATIHRAAFTQGEQATATIAGIPDARFWADAPDAARHMALGFSDQQGEKTMLALSGDADNGAYSAGLLNGWTRAGTRPEFSIVTGVSTGAPIAPFAFLGSDYDAALARLYTQVSAKDIYRGRFPLAILTGPSAASTKPFARLIDAAVSDAMIDKVAAQDFWKKQPPEPSD